MIQISTLIFALSLACDEEPPPEPVPEADEPTEAPLAAPEAPAETAERAAPSAREHEAPDGEVLGVAAEGLGVTVGEAAPDATVEDLQGNDANLEGVDGAVMLVFYRGGWCPYCNFQIRELTESFDQFEARGVTPVLVSVDRPEEGDFTRATYEIPFPVFSDPELRLHRVYNVLHEASDTEVERLGSSGHDIEAYSGQSHHAFAVPSVFVIDAENVVRWQHVDPAYRVRPTVAQLTAVLDELGMSANAD